MNKPTIPPETIASRIIYEMAPKGVWDRTFGEVAQLLHEWKEQCIADALLDVKLENQHLRDDLDMVCSKLEHDAILSDMPGMRVGNYIYANNLPNIRRDAAWIRNRLNSFLAVGSKKLEEQTK